MFEFCDVQEWKWKTANNAWNEEICNQDEDVDFESNNVQNPNHVISSSCSKADDTDDDISLVKFISLNHDKTLRSVSNEKIFFEEHIQITNLTGNATWEREPVLFSGSTSPDPFDNATSSTDDRNESSDTSVRKRGRPRKQSFNLIQSKFNNCHFISNSKFDLVKTPSLSLYHKRSRGRPRRNDVNTRLASVSASGVPSVKRGRGRPKKIHNLGDRSSHRRKRSDSEDSNYELGMEII